MSSGQSHETAQVTLLLAAENSRKRFGLAGEMLVGRDPSCAIVIQSLHISRYHAKIITSAQGSSIEDLNSANGTYINGLRLTGVAPLQVGDLLCFDDHAFRILAAEPITALKTAPSAPTAPLATAPVADNALTKPATEDEKKNEKEEEKEKEEQKEKEEEKEQEDSNLATRRSGVAPLVEVEHSELANVEEIPPQALEPWTQIEEYEHDPAPGDVTRALTFHEMKEILRQSQNAQLAEAAEEPRFTVETAPLQGKIIPLLPLDMDTRWKIGRDLTSKICLRDKSIEIDHAYISRNPSGYRLTATSAGKSFLLNGQPIRDSYLHHGDVVQIGRISLRYFTDVSPTSALGNFTSLAENPGASSAGSQTSETPINWQMWITAGFILLVIVAVLVFAS